MLEPLGTVRIRLPPPGGRGRKVRIRELKAMTIRLLQTILILGEKMRCAPKYRRAARFSSRLCSSFKMTAWNRPLTFNGIEGPERWNTPSWLGWYLFDDYRYVLFRYNNILMILNYALPLVVLIFTYGRVVIVLRKSETIGDTRHQENINAKRRVGNLFYYCQPWKNNPSIILTCSKSYGPPKVTGSANEFLDLWGNFWTVQAPVEIGTDFHREVTNAVIISGRTQAWKAFAPKIQMKHIDFS